MGKTGASFALVGCGSIAKKHVHVIQNILEGSKIAGFCDTVYEKAKGFGERLGVPAFSSIRGMMESIGDEVDIVSVLTPSGVHHQNVLELVEYRKPLVVEKPIALRLVEADEILKACDANHVKIFVVHQNRYNLPVIKAREAMEKGRLGKPVMGTVRLRWKRDQAYYDAAGWRGTWAYDGGVFTNQASHHIDMLTWFMGGVETVKAVGITRLAKIECEDTGAAILRFDNGALGIIEATTATRPRDLEGSISILGEKGTIVIGGFFMNELITWEFEEKEPEDELVLQKYGRNPEVWGYNLGEYLKGVIESTQNGTSGLVDGLEGRKSLELISAIYESIETGNEICLRFHPKKCRLGMP
ncbi:MAG: oxidoreductase [Deltaproteobacteria bacterium HGW-Deltaproteobacteria-21]|nr:MAG: oxidoreductase [Deltaproteobacteria bacterium HGW-Deltaproteobacteria-21]